jgi:hypothetical protein
MLGWPTAPSCSEVTAPGFGNGTLAGARSSGTWMEPDSGDGLMEGLRIISSDTPARIAYLVEPIFDGWSALSLFALGM